MVAKEAKIAKEKKEKTKKAKDEAPDKFASDPRSQRTEAQIFSAFDELLSEKELSKITVTMLTKRAGISRKTFYLHYGSIDDLVDELLRREMATVGETLRSIPLDENGRIDAGAFLSVLCEEILLNFDRRTKILECVNTDRLVDRLKPFLADVLKENNALGLSEELGPYLDIFIAYFCSGFLAVYHHLLATDPELPVENITMLTGAAVTGGIAALAEKATELKIAQS